MSTVIVALKKPVNLPESTQWLAGQGAGSWFYIEIFEDKSHHYRILRYSPSGELECDRIYKSIMPFNLSKPYKFSYLSHCALCTIIQNRKKIIFNWVGE